MALSGPCAVIFPAGVFSLGISSRCFQYESATIPVELCMDYKSGEVLRACLVCEKAILDCYRSVFCLLRRDLGG